MATDRKPFELQVSGDIALFTTPLTKCSGDKSTYPVPTREALNGLLESVYWKPTFYYRVLQVRVINEIRYRYENVLLTDLAGHKDRTYYTYLKNVKYQIRADIVWDESHPELENDRVYQKHARLIRDAIKRGGRKNPFLGTSECMAYVEPCRFGEGRGFYDRVPDINCGSMFHSFVYPNLQTEKDRRVLQGENVLRIVYDQIHMRNGIITFREPSEIPYTISDRAVFNSQEPVFYIPGVNFTPVGEEAV